MFSLRSQVYCKTWISSTRFRSGFDRLSLSLCQHHLSNCSVQV